LTNTDAQANKLEETKAEEPHPETHKAVTEKQPAHLRYKVEPDDTLEWLSLKFSVSVRQMKELNSISSDDIYAGQILNIKPYKDATPEELENHAATPTKTKDDEQKFERRLTLKEESDLEAQRLYYSAIKSFAVLYCTSDGEVTGTLTFSSMCIIFQPNTHRIKKSSHREDAEYFVKRFTMRIDLADIHDSTVLSVPTQEYLNDPNIPLEYSKDYLLQVSLTALGRKFHDPVYDEQFSKLRQERKPFAAVSFRVPSYDADHKKITNDEKSKIAHEIDGTIKSYVKRFNSQNEHLGLYSKSRVPIVDIMFEKFPEDVRVELRKAYVEKTQKALQHVSVQLQEGVSETFEEHKATSQTNLDALSPFSNTIISKKSFVFVPKMKDKSSILDDELFVNLVRRVPSLYQVSDWKLLYSMTRDGISLLNLYRRAEGVMPYLLVLRDAKENIFGAFIADSLEEGQRFYGTGESFLYTFKGDKKKPDCYYWTRKNDYFLYTDGDGISIGSGGNTGLFIRKDLVEGRTYKCETFDNEPLTDTTDFTIMKLELWTIDDYEA